MTEYRDRDDNPLAIVSLENYTLLTRQILHQEAPIFGVVDSQILEGFSNKPENQTD
jgi:hypothetical protein